MSADFFLRPLGVFARRRRWLVAKAKCFVVAVRLLWPDRAGHEVASACRADVAQDRVYAIGAVGAFVSANTRVGAVWRQVFVAEFAVWSEFKHGAIPWG